MGLSSLPAPSEGVLCVLLVNTALSISIVKGIIRSILHIVGIHLSSSSSDSVENPSESFDFCLNTYDNYIEEFQSRTPAIRFDAVCSCKRPEHNCSVCLTQFEPESEINCLSCGHLFHKVCLEKWMNYWNVTCPLCRTPLLPEEEASCFWFSGHHIPHGNVFRFTLCAGNHSSRTKSPIMSVKKGLSTATFEGSCEVVWTVEADLTEGQLLCISGESVALGCWEPEMAILMSPIEHANIWRAEVKFTSTRQILEKVHEKTSSVVSTKDEIEPNHVVAISDAEEGLYSNTLLSEIDQPVEEPWFIHSPLFFFTYGDDMEADMSKIKDTVKDEITHCLIHYA
ncbi:hypothetical protein CRYUN_Cryun01aG0132900 [Craigia yunnanensis]